MFIELFIVLLSPTSGPKLLNTFQATASSIIMTAIGIDQRPIKGCIMDEKTMQQKCITVENFPSSRPHSSHP